MHSESGYGVMDDLKNNYKKLLGCQKTMEMSFFGNRRVQSVGEETHRR